MRHSEKLLNMLGFTYFLLYYQNHSDYLTLVLIVMNLTFIFGFLKEGIRFHYAPYLITLILATVFNILGYGKQLFSLILICISQTSWILTLIYGDCNFDKHQLDGHYGVGYKEIRTIGKGNMIGVYYPMDKNQYYKLLNTSRNVSWFRYGKLSLFAFARATADYGKDNSLPMWLFKSLLGVKLDVIKDAEVHEDFTIGRKMLIPIVYTHGAWSTRTMQSGICRHLASQGYIVFAIEHNDQTAGHTRLKEGTDIFHLNEPGKIGIELRTQQIKIRIQELLSLHDEIEQHDSLVYQLLKFPYSVKINTEKIICSGHSLGAISAVMAAYNDRRVKAVYVFDCWNQIYTKDIDENKTLKLQIPLGIISSETFNSMVIKYMNFDNQKSLQNLLSLCKNKHKENLIIKGIGHLDQCDMACLWPFELSLSSFRFPTPYLGEKYILHARLMSRFLHKIGFSVLEKCSDEMIIEKVEKNWIQYDMQFPSITSQ